MAADPLWRDQGLIFASDTGAALDPENFSRAFAKLCTTAGLGRWHPHELRHSGASLMLAQGTVILTRIYANEVRPSMRTPRLL